MGLKVIANRDLELENLPVLEDESAIFAFGMTFNGYEHYGSLATAADAFRDFEKRANKTEASLSEIRNALFFCCRSSRHMQVDHYIDYYSELQPILFEKIEKKDFT